MRHAVRLRFCRSHPWPLPHVRLLCSCLAGVCFIVLLSCASPEAPLSLPEQIGIWTRTGESTVASKSVPESLQRLQARGGVSAVYRSADATLQATVYEMPSATSAFEAVQTYTRAADEYYFQKGLSFIVLNLKELPMEARRPFLLAFQQATSPDGPDPDRSRDQKD